MLSWYTGVFPLWFLPVGYVTKILDVTLQESIRALFCLDVFDTLPVRDLI